MELAEFLKRRQKNSVETDLGDIACEVKAWFDLVQRNVRWQSVVNTMKIFGYRKSDGVLYRLSTFQGRSDSLERAGFQERILDV